MPRTFARRRALALAAAALAVLAAATGSPAVAVPPPPEEAVRSARLVSDGARVLFVGNSFTQGFEEPVVSFERDEVHDVNGTRVGGVPATVGRLSRDLGVNLEVTVEAVGGRSLRWHLEQHPDIFDQPWDAVVAQEFSLQALPATHGGAAEQFRSAARTLHDRVRTAHPRVDTVLFQTWASPTSARLQGYGEGPAALRAMQADLDAVYAAEAQETGWTRTAPVGDAFVRAVDEGVADAVPEDGVAAGTVRLWSEEDHRHAAAAGSYLAATVLTATLTHRNPQLLPTGEGSAAAALGIDPAAAAALHRIAADLVPVPPAVSTEVRTLCVGDAVAVRALVRNGGDTPVTVWMRGGARVPEVKVPPGTTVAIAVPLASDDRVPRALRWEARAEGHTGAGVLHPTAPACSV